MEARFARVVSLSTLFVCLCPCACCHAAGYKTTNFTVSAPSTDLAKRSAIRPRSIANSWRSNGSAKNCRPGRSPAQSRRKSLHWRRRRDELCIRPRRSVRLEDEHSGLARADSRLGAAARSHAHDFCLALPPAVAAVGGRRRLHDGRTSKRSLEAGRRMLLDFLMSRPGRRIPTRRMFAMKEYPAGRAAAVRAGALAKRVPHRAAW